MARILLSPHNLTDLSQRLRSTAEDFGRVPGRLGAATAEVRLNREDPRFDPARFAERLDRVGADLRQLAEEVGAVAATVAVSAHTAEVLDGRELGAHFGDGASTLLPFDRLADTGFPPVPSALLADLIPRPEGGPPGSVAAEPGGWPLRSGPIAHSTAPRSATAAAVVAAVIDGDWRAMAVGNHHLDLGRSLEPFGGSGWTEAAVPTVPLRPSVPDPSTLLAGCFAAGPDAAGPDAADPDAAGPDAADPGLAR